MKPLLVVMAHKAAEHTLNRHAEMFLRQGCDVVGFSPQDGTVFPWPMSFAYGKSEHSGPSMIARTWKMLRTVRDLASEDQMIIITEADQVFCGPPLGLKKWKADTFTSPWKRNYDPTFEEGFYPAIPWVMDWATAESVANHLEALAGKDWNVGKGFNDRALGAAVQRMVEGQVNWAEIKDHWTDETDLAEKANPAIWDELAWKIHRGEVSMVHSIKTQEQWDKLHNAIARVRMSGIPA